MSPAAKDPDQSTYSGRFAARLRMLREKTGLSVDQVVERATRFNKSSKSVTQNKIYDWESGRSMPHADIYPAMALALKCKTLRDMLPAK